MFESKSGVLFVAGLVFFGLAFVSNAVVPALMYRHLPSRRPNSWSTATCAISSKTWPSLSDGVHRKAYGTPPTDHKREGNLVERQVRRGPAHRSQGLRRRRLLALPQPVRPPGLQRGTALGPGLAILGIPERTAAAGDVRHAARRPRPVPRRGPALERLARRPLLQADERLRRVRPCPNIRGCSTARPTSRRNADWP